MDGLQMDSWVVTGWIGGLLIGSFIVLHFLVVGRGAGCSSGYACAINGFYKDNLFGKLDPLKFFFIIGMPLGGFIHAFVFQGGDWGLSFDMGIYETILPASDEMKTLILFAGGLLLGLGARMAGGCTTGHALVGGALLNWVSIMAAMLFFVFATGTTWLLFTFL